MWLGNDTGAKRKTSDGRTNKEIGSTSSALFKEGQGGQEGMWAVQSWKWEQDFLCAWLLYWVPCEFFFCGVELRDEKRKWVNVTPKWCLCISYCTVSSQQNSNWTFPTYCVLYFREWLQCFWSWATVLMSTPYMETLI